MPTLLRWAIKGLLGVLAFLAWQTSYAGIPESVSEQAAFVQALGGEWLLRYIELPLLGLILALIVVGPARIRKSAREAIDWYRNKPESEASRELEAQERWRGQDALDSYLEQMQRWLDDENKPLLELPPEAPRRRLARTRTLEVLKRVGPDGKRSVLQFLHEQGLIKHSENVISMRDADLSRANLSGMSLTNTNLDYAILRDADLGHAKLCRYFTRVKEGQVTRGQEGGEPFDRMHPTQASSFFNAKLDGANLTGAALAGCYLIGADLISVDLDRADLRGAELRMTRNLTQEQIERAYGSYGQEDMPDTQLPDHLEAPEAWCKPLSLQKSERE